MLLSYVAVDVLGTWCVANDKSSNDRRLKVPQLRGTRVALRCWVAGELPCQLIKADWAQDAQRMNSLSVLLVGEGVKRTIEAIVQFENPQKARVQIKKNAKAY